MLIFATALCARHASALPQRIVLGGKAVVMVADAAYLFPQAVQSVVAVAGADQGLGVFLSAIDPSFSGKNILDRAAGAEAYAAQRPDLVILKSSMRKSLGAPLDALGIGQLYLDLETPEDYLEEIGLLGEAFGAPERARELRVFYENALSDVEARLAAGPALSQPRVLVLQSSAGGYEAPPASWIQTILVERAGGTPVWKDANPGSGWAKIGIEQIAAWNADLVFVVSYREDSHAAAAALAAEPSLASTVAVRAGRVFGFPQDFYSWDQPDTRWVLGLRWMAKRLHPERFADMSIQSEAERFFGFCYGMDAARYARNVRSKLSGDYGD